MLPLSLLPDLVIMQTLLIGLAYRKYKVSSLSLCCQLLVMCSFQTYAFSQQNGKKKTKKEKGWGRGKKKARNLLKHCLKAKLIDLATLIVAEVTSFTGAA